MTALAAGAGSSGSRHPRNLPLGSAVKTSTRDTWGRLLPAGAPCSPPCVSIDLWAACPSACGRGVLLLVATDVSSGRHFAHRSHGSLGAPGGEVTRRAAWSAAMVPSGGRVASRMRLVSGAATARAPTEKRELCDETSPVGSRTGCRCRPDPWVSRRLNLEHSQHRHAGIPSN